MSNNIYPGFSEPTPGLCCLYELGGEAMAISILNLMSIPDKDFDTKQSKFVDEITNSPKTWGNLKQQHIDAIILAYQEIKRERILRNKSFKNNYNLSLDI